MSLQPLRPAARRAGGRGELESPNVMRTVTRRRRRHPSSGGGEGAECRSRRSGRSLAVRGGAAGVSKCDAHSNPSPPSPI